MKQIKEEKDNEIRNITGMYETTVNSLKTEVNNGCQQIQSLKAEKVNVYLSNTYHVYKNNS